ncbi:DUF6168 family protein [uncultured Aquimarina sp.]|uniref:DUF6168 family protein n=1 Tax=uncultured Aquimarina sp. TaxID=575652 RepID=UPI00343B94A4
MPKSLPKFSLLFLLVLTITYFVHSTLISTATLENQTNILNFSYIFNGIYTLCLVIAIILLLKKLKDQIGFIFLAGSFLKIGLFLAFTKFNSLEIDKSVFLDFFIPYLVSLVLEVLFVSKILNNIK